MESAANTLRLLTGVRAHESGSLLQDDGLVSVLGDMAQVCVCIWVCVCVYLNMRVCLSVSFAVRLEIECDCVCFWMCVCVCAADWL